MGTGFFKVRDVEKHEHRNRKKWHVR
jgi:hypothetical protein